MRRVILLLLSVTSVVPMSAHAVGTHVKITSAAVQYLLNNLSNEDSKSLKDCLPAIEHLLQEGTAQEDLAPGNRFMFHFTPALHDKVHGIIEVEAHCSSMDWAFSYSSSEPGIPFLSKACSHNQFIDYNDYWWVANDSTTTADHRTVTKKNEHTWYAAVFAGLATDIETRKQGWRHLGYVLHLLQDLTSPAHVRSDGHPPVVDPDPVEAIEPRIPILPDAAALVDLPDAADYFQSLQSWTQNNFFSKDTAFAKKDLNGDLLGGPTAAKIDYARGYIYDADNHLIAHIGPGALIAAALGHSSDQVLRQATVDATVADDQWTRLGTQAVLYTASLIYKYWQSVGHALPCSSKASCYAFTGTVTSRSENPPVPVKDAQKGDLLTVTAEFDPQAALVENFPHLNFYTWNTGDAQVKAGIGATNLVSYPVGGTGIFELAIFLGVSDAPIDPADVFSAGVLLADAQEARDYESGKGELPYGVYLTLELAAPSPLFTDTVFPFPLPPLDAFKIRTFKLSDLDGVNTDNLDHSVSGTVDSIASRECVH